MPRAPVLAVLAVIAAVAAAGCGSESDVAAFPAAAGPARSPAPAARPEGRVVRVGGTPVGVAVDQRTGTVAVLARGPDELVVLDPRTLAVERRTALPRPGRDVEHAGGGFRVVRGRGPAADRAAIDGGPLAVLLGRERALRLVDRGTGRRLDQVAAGVGPTHVEAGDDGRVYVADTDGGSVLLFRTRPELGLVRRAALPGAPYATTLDRDKGKLWVTLTATNEVAQLTADGRPREQRRYPTVRQPDAVAIHEATGTVYVAGAGGTLQAFAGYPSR